MHVYIQSCMIHLRVHARELWSRKSLLSSRVASGSVGIRTAVFTRGREYFVRAPHPRVGGFCGLASFVRGPVETAAFSAADGLRHPSTFVHRKR